jgi:DNA modification methylase
MTPYWATADGRTVRVYRGHAADVLDRLRPQFAHCCVTSPPYWGLRDYKTGSADEIGSERTPEEYVEKMVNVFRSVRRVLRDDGTLWLNLGDAYNSPGENRQGKSSKTLDGGESRSLHMPVRSANHSHRVGGTASLKKGNLVGIPWRVALAMQADGWVLRQEIIWHKPNPMPDSMKNRCTKSHEQIFLFAKKGGYYYDNEAIKEESVGLDRVKKEKSKGMAGVRPHKHGDEFGHKGALGGQHGTRPETANKRSVWTVPTFSYPGAHYATFPPKLIEPCVLAGTSEKGCCPDCGAPWERVMKETGKLIRWQPRCTCRNPKVIPCTVLDPFLGSGTTCEVAIKHGRRSVGVELSEKYVERNVVPRVCTAIQKYRPTRLDLIPD